MVVCDQGVMGRPSACINTLDIKWTVFGFDMDVPPVLSLEGTTIAAAYNTGTLSQF